MRVRVGDLARMGLSWAISSVALRPSAGKVAAPTATETGTALRASSPHPVVIITGTYGAPVLEPLVGVLSAAARTDVSLLVVDNEFFGGNIGVTGLLTGRDVARALEREAPYDGRVDAVRFLLPDVVLSNGRFLDGTTVDELPQRVEVVPTDGASLVAAITP